eukprot:TRINITY_DN11980_c0_g4_i2.p3 TRINITY_DN11980_c0_g4~~TRINITY_DN11980_c0_g4_i2.p3  ORF type:complete len:119 (+),score=0.89 TRINITY_DN11980_c0_g4_i2:3020-3376(+)
MDEHVANPAYHQLQQKSETQHHGLPQLLCAACSRCAFSISGIRQALKSAYAFSKSSLTTMWSNLPGVLPTNYNSVGAVRLTRRGSLLTILKRGCGLGQPFGEAVVALSSTRTQSFLLK